MKQQVTNQEGKKEIKRAKSPKVADNQRREVLEVVVAIWVHGRLTIVSIDITKLINNWVL